jgi:hypothetical protein
MSQRTSYRALSTAIALAAAAAVGLSTSAARADDTKYMANLKLGVGVPLTAFAPTGFVLAPEFGFKLFEDTLLKGGDSVGDRAYLTINPAFQFGGGGTYITIPAGFQYEVKLPGKLEALAPYASFSLGYVGAFGGGGSMHGLAFIPAFGAKYSLLKVGNGDLHVGVEPLNFEIMTYFSRGGGTISYYRFLGYGGLTF